MTTFHSAMGLSKAAPNADTDALSWAEKWSGASCTETDGELWFSESIVDRRKAIAICQGCPLKLECAEISAHEQHGIWAGIDRADPTRQKRVEYNRARDARQAATS